jgi:hypothetical protein
MLFKEIIAVYSENRSKIYKHKIQRYKMLRLLEHI